MDIEDLGHLARKPKVTNYNPCTVRNLKPGSIKEWCTCGLTKKGPWCDGKSHKGTTFKPLRWRVPDGKNTQTYYSICDCRYTTRPPFCDGIHYDLPLRYMKKIKECPKQPHDPAVTKLCEECGWAAPRESWPEIPSSESSDEDSDSDLSDKEESEEKKAKQLAANTPKVQVQLETTSDQKQESSSPSPSAATNDGSTMDVDAQEPKILGCNGSCQTRKLDQDASVTDPAVSQIADETQRMQL